MKEEKGSQKWLKLSKLKAIEHAYCFFEEDKQVYDQLLSYEVKIELLKAFYESYLDGERWFKMLDDAEKEYQELKEQHNL